jgi:ureidoacrylate peracid hydrolase
MVRCSRSKLEVNMPRPLLFTAALVLAATIAHAQQQASQVELHAQPASVTINSQQTALIVVDMQNDFGGKGGMFDRAGIGIEPIRAIVPALARTIAAAHEIGIQVIYLKMGFQPDLSDLAPRDAPNYLKHQRLHVGEPNTAPDGTASRILVRDTWDTDIIPELKPTSRDIVMWKHRFSGFHETDLDATLKRLGIRYLIFTGATTSVCVESTMRDAMFLDYIPVLLTDTTAEARGREGNYKASIQILTALFGWISDSNEFIRALKNETAKK